MVLGCRRTNVQVLLRRGGLVVEPWQDQRARDSIGHAKQISVVQISHWRGPTAGGWVGPYVAGRGGPRHVIGRMPISETRLKHGAVKRTITIHYKPHI